MMNLHTVNKDNDCDLSVIFSEFLLSIVAQQAACCLVQTFVYLTNCTSDYLRHGDISNQSVKLIGSLHTCEVGLHRE